MLTADEALSRLKAGNRRFASGKLEELGHCAEKMHRQSLVAGQHPIAIILSCSDSRVPAELVFDQGLGELFVTRVAGNIAAPSQIGSIEFAAEKFGIPLVVVLGHSCCGAVSAALEELKQPSTNGSAHVLSIVNRIKIILEPLYRNKTQIPPEELLSTAIRTNIEATVRILRYTSAILEERIQQGKLTIIGAEYSLETGEVCFFE